MDTQTLEARRATVIARHEVLESVPGSGWHETDPAVLNAKGPNKVPLSRRPVLLVEDMTGYFVGPDAIFVRDKLADYVAKGLNKDANALVASTFEAASRFARGDEPVLTLVGSDRNSVTYALACEDVLVVSTGVRA